ncbi:MAG: serine--tRNA ligase [Pseudohongiellaceae bacterium]
MLDPKWIRNEPEAVAAKLQKKHFTLNVELLAVLDAKRKEIQLKTESLQNTRNNKSKEIGRIKADIPKNALSLVSNNPGFKSPLSELMGEMESLKGELEKNKAELGRIQDELDSYLLGVPNVPTDDVPEGKDEGDNPVLSSWGQTPEFGFPLQDHSDLGESLAGEGLDFAAATRIVGARFVVMQGQVARLHRALIQFMLDIHTREHGYKELNVPYVVNSASLLGTGQLPKFAEDLFKLEGEQGYYLIPTAEVPVTNLVREQIIAAQDLPLKYACHTPCFRAEAGSYGKDTKGMIRQHQFEKVELVQLVRPEDSPAALEELTEHAERILQLLELPYRKVLLCGGEMGFAAAKTYDLEVWLPSQNTYREISSCSTFTDFQARRMQARWRNPASGKPELLHTLNGSGLAIGRTLVAILENCQQADGKVKIPAKLVPYMDGLEYLAANTKD